MNSHVLRVNGIQDNMKKLVEIALPLYYNIH